MNIHDRIEGNPHRVLGVYVGSRASVELRNKNRIAACSRVDQPVSFSFPVDDRLSAIKRTEASAEEAMRTLARPEDRLENALFWIGDGETGWSRELNGAIDALLCGNLMKAMHHYGNIFYDDNARSDFQKAVTHGLLSLSAEELTRMLCDILKSGEYDIFDAYRNADTDILPNPIIRRLGRLTIFRDIESTTSFDEGPGFISFTLRKPDFYNSYNLFLSNIDRLLPLDKTVAWAYGKDSVFHAEFSEQLAREIYQKASAIIDSIGEWIWRKKENTGKNNNGIQFVSSKPRECVESCMGLISRINGTVEDAINRLQLSSPSTTILWGALISYEDTLRGNFTTDKDEISKSVRRHRIKSAVRDVIWLSVLSLIFFLI